MRKLGTLTAAAAFAAMGFNAAAWADDNADTVPSYNEGSFAEANNPADAVDGSNATFTSLGLNGDITVEFTDNVAVDGVGDDIRIFDRCGVNEAVEVLVSNDGTNFVSLGLFIATDFTNDSCGAGTSNATLDLDLSGSGLGGATHVMIDDDNDSTDEDGTGDAGLFERFYGLDIEEVVALHSLNFGTAHIAKANQGAGTIGIQSKGGDDAEQFFSFKITIANPEDEDLSELLLKDVLPAEFDLDPIEELDNSTDNGGTADDDLCEDPNDIGNFVDCGILDVANVILSGLCDDGACDGVEVTGGTDPDKCTATGAEHTNQGKSGKPFKLQPDIVSITDITLDDDESCEITVWAMTDRKSNKPNKVNFTPTECNEGTFIFLNEGVEVIDTMGTTDPSDDVTLFVDDDRIELICTGP